LNETGLGRSLETCFVQGNTSPLINDKQARANGKSIAPLPEEHLLTFRVKFYLLQIIKTIKYLTTEI